MLKVISLFKRRADLEVIEFHERFLEARSTTRVSDWAHRYVQSQTLPQGYAKGELLFDAVEEFWCGPDDVLDLFQKLECDASSEQVQGLLDTSRTVQFVVEPNVVKNKAVPPCAVKNIEFVTRRPGMEQERFHRYWKDVHGPLGSQIESILRYEQNHTLRLSGRAAIYDGLAITWFASTAAMRDGAKTEEYRLTREDEPNFLPDGHLPIIITREVMDSGS